MGKYWVYLNDAVAGPFSLEQLIRQRGFSRQTQVCVDDGAAPGEWITSAQIPELQHIFQAVDLIHDAPPSPPSKPLQKAPVRPEVRAAPPPKVVVSTGWSPWHWLWLLPVVGVGAWVGVQHLKRESVDQQMAAVQAVAMRRLPSTSLYSTLQQYIDEKNLKPRWVPEATPTGLWNVTLSWTNSGPSSTPLSSVYGFEVNLQAQTVRGLNTSGIKLLSEGFPPPPSKAIERPATAKKPVAPKFDRVLSAYSSAVAEGNFSKVWDSFSESKRDAMIKAGISKDGFIRLQSLTHRLEERLSQAVIKIKQQDPDHMLVLLRQSQANHPDLYVKQSWTKEGDVWKLDSEERKTAEDSEQATSAGKPPLESSGPDSRSAGSPSPSPFVSTDSRPARRAVLSLPGVAN